MMQGLKQASSLPYGSLLGRRTPLLLFRTGTGTFLLHIDSQATEDLSRAINKQLFLAVLTAKTSDASSSPCRAPKESNVPARLLERVTVHWMNQISSPQWLKRIVQAHHKTLNGRFLNAMIQCETWVGLTLLTTRKIENVSLWFAAWDVDLGMSRAMVASDICVSS